jgi:hypothetical protein
VAGISSTMTTSKRGPASNISKSEIEFESGHNDSETFKMHYTPVLLNFIDHCTGRSKICFKDPSTELNRSSMSPNDST